MTVPPHLIPIVERALAEPPARVRAIIGPDGERLWLKRIERPTGLMRLQKGSGRRAFEAERLALRVLGAAGLPVAPVLAEGPDFLLLPDTGRTLKQLAADPSTPEADRLEAFAAAGHALARLHRFGYVHGRPAARDMCWRQGELCLIDFERFRNRRSRSPISAIASQHEPTVSQLLARSRQAHGARPPGVWSRTAESATLPGDADAPRVLGKHQDSGRQGRAGQVRPGRIVLHPCRTLVLGVMLLFAPFGAPPAAAFGGLFGPCEGDCAVGVYGGHYVQDSMNDILILHPKFPTDWTFDSDGIIATAFSREWLSYRDRIFLEPEIGIGQRFGEQDETEFWGALFVRYRGFPWDDWVTTSVAISTGMNYATGTSEKEIERNGNDEGSRWLHFLSPEITFALPSQPNVELLFRLHHRSGIFGTINGAGGGNQYGTVGLRVRF